jgi:hypothetical protein
MRALCVMCCTVTVTSQVCSGHTSLRVLKCEHVLSSAAAAAVCVVSLSQLRYVVCLHNNCIILQQQTYKNGSRY